VPAVERPEINHIYVWRSRTDEFKAVKRPHRYIEQMNLHTGMTEKEITDDQKEKGKILQWMMDKDISDIEQVGRVMQTYYSDAASVVKAAEKKLSLDKLG